MSDDQVADAIRTATQESMGLVDFIPSPGYRGLAIIACGGVGGCATRSGDLAVRSAGQGAMMGAIESGIRLLCS